MAGPTRANYITDILSVLRYSYGIDVARSPHAVDLNLFSDYNANQRLIEFLKGVNDCLLVEDDDEPPFEIGRFGPDGLPKRRAGPKVKPRFERADPSDPKDVRLPRQTWEQEQRYAAFEDQRK